MLNEYISASELVDEDVGENQRARGDPDQAEFPKEVHRSSEIPEKELDR